MKYKKKISLFLPIKKIDLYVLETFLFKLYKPRSKNYVICIGGMYGEHDLIKLFHKKNYNIKSSIVSACNILPIYLMHSINYDYRFGGFKGDASKELMWENAKKKLGIKKFDYYTQLHGQSGDWLFVIDYKGFETCIQFRRLSKIKTWLNNFLKYPTTRSSVLPASFILDLKPLYDPKKEIIKLKKKLKFPNHENMHIVPFDHIIKDRIMSDDILPYLIKRKSYLQIEFHISRSLREYMHVLYSLNKKFFTSAKWYDKEIKKFKIKPKNCIKRIEQIATLGSKGPALKRRIKTFQSLIKDTEPFVDRHRKK